MSFLTLKSKSFLLTAAILSLTMAASCDLPASNTNSSFEFTGQVLDFDTKQPIEGAYALAVYQKVEIGLGGTADYCYKTKGMTTGKDGKFSFPLEQPTSLNPDIVTAIKADYFYRDMVIPKPSVQKAQTKEAYTNRHVYLKKQDPAKPSFQLSEPSIYCTKAKSSEDAEAAIQFYEIELKELTKYGLTEKQIENAKERIISLRRQTSK